ncbi:MULTISPECIES: flippase [unclassified Rathayibacter]|uniref:flippase n=1 Tax=unclassified Rathayibacter TaxID=2609250 RepID=UPI000FAB8747|nr:MULTISPECIES: flippase [unclassified Rathayibacter]ROP57733.1 O-antigen/teichoic acid export membrane protein [Rathayibacter sp. PhB186]ROS56118.1 O-antigen/teichoic acid export membrane protein [Rathayibacter sp. PhB185]
MKADVADAEFSRRRSLGSAAWATIQQFVTLGSTALSGIILARLLSVSDFGIFSYATSLASMGMVVVTAGLSGLALKLLVSERSNERALMTGLILTREFFALIAYLVLLAVALLSGSGANVAATAIALLVMFARAFDASEYWFQSRAESSRTAPIRISVVLLFLAVRIALALLGAELIVFLLLYVAESVVVSIGLVVRYLRDPRSPGFGRPEAATPRRMLHSSWLLLLSGIAGQINSRGDVIIVQALLGNAAVGLYSAAARLSELFYFLPVVFMTATFPRLINIRNKFGKDSAQYRVELQRSYDQSCWVGIGIAVLVFLGGPWALALLYGERYADAGAILQVHVLALPFVFMAAVFSKWIIAENLLIASLIRHAFGAALNVGLNLFLVPSVGLIGAAYATVVSYVVSSYLACFATRSTRPAGIQMSLALVWPIRLAFGVMRNALKKGSAHE